MSDLQKELREIAYYLTEEVDNQSDAVTVQAAAEVITTLETENAQLRAELATAKADSTRLEWLVYSGIYKMDVTPLLLERDWREAIDEARGVSDEL
jgi:hypothetical protein